MNIKDFNWLSMFNVKIFKSVTPGVKCRLFFFAIGAVSEMGSSCCGPVNCLWFVFGLVVPV